MARTRKQTAAHWEPLDAIEPWADNPRDNADNVARVAASIERFGFGAPVVANKRDGQIIAGHTRLLAAKQLGLDKVPVRWLDLEPDEAHALALADNRLTELSPWDDAALEAVLAELQQNAPDLVPLTGFDPDALAAMLEPEEPPEEHDDPDTWDGDVEAITQAGDEIDLGKHRLVCGDCVAEMRKLPDGSVDAIVTDPPYGLGFMGKEWDALPPGPEWAEQCLRVLKPGGHVVAFGGTRTVHRLAVALEDAGFEIRDTIHWCYWSGFPKSLDVSKAIDKQRHDPDEVLQVTGWIKQERDRAGVSNKQIDKAFGMNGMAGHWTSTKSQPAIPTLDQVPQLIDLLGVSLDDVPEEIRELIWTLNGHQGQPGAAWFDRPVDGHYEQDAAAQVAWGTAKPGKEIRNQPATEAARTWQGWGTALKPALEPAILARKPMTGTVADCVQEHGTGALNIDACRIAPGDKAWPGPSGEIGTHTSGDARMMRAGKDASGWRDGHVSEDPGGRWPANLYHCPKPATAEREAGTEGLERPSAAVETHGAGTKALNSPRAGAGRTATTRGNHHPTVKPVSLMRWLVRLVTPPGGTVLEPFAGSGTTLVACEREGVAAIGFELSPDYCDIIRARVQFAIEDDRT